METESYKLMQLNMDKFGDGPFDQTKHAKFSFVDEPGAFAGEKILLYAGNGTTGPFHWRGWNVKPDGENKWFRQSAWIKFERSVPKKSGGFGFKIHGNLFNSFVDIARPDKWLFVSYVSEATGGDHGYILFIFDSMGGKNP